MRIDEFFDKQPEPKFIDWLNSPLHESAPEIFGKREIRAGEVDAVGAYISSVHEGYRELILTATEDLEKFLRVAGVFGDKYPIEIAFAEGFSEESYSIEVTEEKAIIRASDSEGARRAVYYLEEEMIKREGAFLPLGTIRRDSLIKRRITRGFFSPTNRAPKWGDELLDEIDYYPENYLSRLAHNGTNGLWIYTSFAQLLSSPYLPSKDENCEKRMEKLARVTEKCKRYGIKVYVFAIEPMGLLAEECEPYLDMLGADATSSFPAPRRPFCPRIDKTRDHIIYCIEHIFKTIPDLAGYISITAGERPTTCSSVGTYKTCPRCGKYSRGENLAFSVDVIKEGLRRAGTGAEFISWTYGHRYWEDPDIVEYIDKTPSDVVIMQNFEDRGTDIQLGKPRIAWDYWLSYPGPSDMFKMSARESVKTGHPTYAKMQVCSSHEIATVPYIPAPGILFDKYSAAVELGVTGIMECWYFGNYPSLMNRASTELSYVGAHRDKRAFLVELAARLYGESRAVEVADAFEAFEESYRNYPTNIMFSYYGPMHDGITWDLFPIPQNRALPRSWLLLDAPDGDRIGECLFKGHTLDEALTLADRMCESWNRGLSRLPLSANDEHTTCAKAIDILFESGRDILEFYKLREELGSGVGDARDTVTKMETITVREIYRTERMIDICERDPRIGYHSEAEGFKFFPEKMRARIEKLWNLMEKDFIEIRERIEAGKPPLGYYFAEGYDAYPLGCDRESAEVVNIDALRSFSIWRDGENMKIDINCPRNDKFSACFEYALFRPECNVTYSPTAGGVVHGEVAGASGAGLALGPNVLSHQSVYGDGIAEELSNYSVESDFTEESAHHVFTAKIPEGKWNGKCAIKLALRIGGKPWKFDSDPVRTLGKGDVSPDDFGFIMPICK